MIKVYRSIKNIAHIVIDPILNGLDRIKFKIELFKTRRMYELTVHKIQNREEKKIKIAAYVIFDSTFGMESVFDRMMEDRARWQPQIVVIPDVSRGKVNQLEVYNKTKEYFIRKYGRENVLDGWNIKNNSFYDHTRNFDIIYFANPYDGMVNKVHSIRYAATREVLPIYISYGYDVGQITTISRLKNAELNLVWKYFVDTTYSLEDMKKYQIVKGENAILTGYSKMDKLNDYVKKKTEKKKILIAVHHTVDSEDLPLSNFLSYHKLFLELPRIYPDIEFVLRPHPLLFTTLINKGIWNRKQVDEYIKEFELRGGKYSCEGDYLQLFMDCDAMINDCGSFTIEWLYTGKAGCFMLNPRLKKSLLTNLMNRAISCYSIAKEEQDIIDFVDKVARDKEVVHPIPSWIKDNIMLNYPDTASIIMKELSISGEDI